MDVRLDGAPTTTFTFYSKYLDSSVSLADDLINLRSARVLKPSGCQEKEALDNDSI